MYPQVFGKYVLERELSRGGMARVVLATLRGAGGFEKKLVVKQIRDELASDDDFVRRFVEEAKTTVALAHPNIVTVYELGVELGTYFLAMELVQGVSAAELLRGPDGERRALTPEEGAYVGVELCRALDYAHRRMHVVHRDVTPRNVMVDEEGQIKVIDFGIATPVATAPSGQGVFGSPGHMPPEQIAGGELTPAADVFAAAVLLMELWTGKAPFRRQENDAIEAAMRAPHPKPSDHDARLAPLDDVIGAAMALDPGLRPQNADDLGRALRKFLAGVDLGDLARALGERVRKARERPAGKGADDRPKLQRPPSRPSATQMGTKTFAAREEVAGTRRMPASEPPAAIETIATRPLESGPRREARAVARRGGIWVAALAVMAAAGGVYAGTRGASGTPVGTRAGAATATATATGTATGTATATGTTTATATGTATGTAAATGTATASTVGTAAAASGEAAVDPDDPPQLTLLGAHAQVSLDGTPRGACPVHVALDPGLHTVLFTYPATGESKGETVSLKARDRLTLRADFTGATPSIRVQH